ncbi:hypothetical protein PPYR_11745 [Photinus pyralis]|uniref:Uncharacterized protein n=1 Tax=Photinus pyralis TaxID=7054 RepID=A0A1Y1LSK5_PHOPY|nr:uncharacterized protein LOC116176085 [Photinus pyralis]XP_031350902.1 uncharacterized protein LOC116176459 [Photinus pyralis]KAB0794904.1 hypothetical protein PPYR_11743 [Photinus pyralis]KAB0794906.1 hypothetical protein PPYR_11745 [Photinus pyralis]
MSDSNQSSTGKNRLDTPDFLAFSDASCVGEFSPTVSSSPQKQWYGNQAQNISPYYFNNRPHGNPRYSPNNTPPHKVFQSFTRNHRKPNFKGSNSFNSYFQKSTNRSFNSGRNDSSSMSKYIHPSFMEDPWLELEKQLNASNSNNSSKETTEDYINETVEEDNEAVDDYKETRENYSGEKVED